MTKKFDVIHHNGNILVVDKEAEIKEDDWVYEKSLSNDMVFKVVKRNNELCFFRFRIVPIWLKTTVNSAVKIIASSSPIEGIHLIKIEEDVEKEAQAAFINSPGNYHQKDFVNGYKAAKAKQYTEEDVKNAIIRAWDKDVDTKNIDDIIASLRPTIRSVDLEVELISPFGKPVTHIGYEVEEGIENGDYKVVPKLIDNHVIVKEVYYVN